jgi:GDP-4-dehydro-6-deoxy-D-mannose reductase
MKILITGVTGFVGRHLVEHLQHDVPDAEIWGLVWEEDAAQVPTAVHHLAGDLTLPSSLARSLEHVRPDVVLHLAGATSVASSWQQPDRSFQVNAIGTLNLLEALRSLDIDPTVVVATSAEIYGAVARERQPIGEGSPLCPISPYATSKAAQDLIAAQYHLGFKLRTIRLRLFPHTGPGRPPQFAASAFARQIARIERGLERPVMAVGNLDPIRDFTDVRDIARAYWAAAVRGRAGEAYNVGSGRGISIREVLEHLIGLSDTKIDIRVDPDRLRPADIDCLVADTSLFAAATGWQPEIPIEQTLADLLEWWRSRVEQSDELNSTRP